MGASWLPLNNNGASAPTVLPSSISSTPSGLTSKSPIPLSLKDRADGDGEIWKATSQRAALGEYETSASKVTRLHHCGR